MLIINTNAKQLGKYRRIYLYSNGLLLDQLRPNEIKKYTFKPGSYEIVLKMSFYRSRPVTLNFVNGNETYAYEMKFREDYRFLFYMIIFSVIGIGIDFSMRTTFSSVENIHTYMNIFIVVYFIGLFLSNFWINKYKYLKLISMPYKIGGKNENIN